jgi:hypothetical protein
MNKKKKEIFMFTPLVLVSLFNAAFIFYKLRGTDYPKDALRILYDYSIGFHLIPLLIIMGIIFLFFLRKKLSLHSLFLQLFLVFLLFIISMNIALFPEINQRFALGKYDLKWKRNSSMSEAMTKSPSKIIPVLKSYYRMKRYLNNKILILPTNNPLEKDYFFWALITPHKVSYEEYEYILSSKNFKQLRRFESNVFNSIERRTRIKNFLIINGFAHTNKYFLYRYEQTIIFVPLDLSEKLSLNQDD